MQSDWVRKEIDLALELERHWGMKVLLPVKCRDFEWPPELEHLEDLKYADFTGQRHLALMDLISTLRQ